MSESFVTKCPHCETSFRLTAEHLSAANGQVRCGACLQVFSAKESLKSSQVLQAQMGSTHASMQNEESNNGDLAAKQSENNTIVTDNKVDEEFAHSLFDDQPSMDVSLPDLDFNAIEQATTSSSESTLFDEREESLQPQAATSPKADLADESMLSVDMDDAFAQALFDDEPSLGESLSDSDFIGLSEFELSKDEALPESKKSDVSQGDIDASSVMTEASAVTNSDEAILADLDQWFADTSTDTEAVSDTFDDSDQVTDMLFSDPQEQANSEEAKSDTESKPVSQDELGELDEFFKEENSADSQNRPHAGDEQSGPINAVAPATVQADVADDDLQLSDSFLNLQEEADGNVDSEAKNISVSQSQPSELDSAQRSAARPVNNSMPDAVDIELELDANSRVNADFDSVADLTLGDSYKDELTSEVNLQEPMQLDQRPDTPNTASAGRSHKQINQLASAEDELDKLAENLNKKGWWAQLFWILIIFCAAGGLGAQYVYFNFDDLAQDEKWQVELQNLCDLVGCQLPEPEESYELTMSSFDYRASQQFKNVTELSFILSNDFDVSQRFPNILVEAIDDNGAVIGDQLFAPKQYLKADLLGADYLAARTEASIRISIKFLGSKVAGYQLSMLEP